MEINVELDDGKNVLEKLYVPQNANETQIKNNIFVVKLELWSNLLISIFLIENGRYFCIFLT